MHQVAAIVVGAGVIGLAIARLLARHGIEVIILEQEKQLGDHTSSRNSEVIHAGIYYPPHSLKASLCVAGKHLLYDYCAKYNVPYKKIGKLIVANSTAELKKLHNILLNAKLAGVNDLIQLGAQQITELEPQIAALQGLYSPSTGIIDVGAFMLSLLGDAEQHGAMLVKQSKVIEVDCAHGISVTIVDESGAVSELHTKYFVNAGGLFAVELAKAYKNYPLATIPAMYYCKGNYFQYSGGKLFKHLIYPIPEEHALGIHVTLDLAGNVRFGPDIEWLDKIDYTVDEARVDMFYSTIKSYWPAVDKAKLYPAYSGIRPKLTAPNMPAQDFVVQDRRVHGVNGLINLFGIESPGITAALSLAEVVVKNLSINSNVTAY